ncbi:hypothetical protein SADUNF_Sadunf01G0090500 [Salix dunnii]|uniref:Cytochrome P450 n=1 Tax=Salix dunnii TaxID=1413687 RepID=A0A835NA96_9ROSI|nr:hypothetical protein SADUNF_Sadunf01G0090500 [Salix dunnii]
MESLINTVLCVLFSFALVKILHFIAKGSKTGSSGKLPPGPVALPIIGSLLDLGDKPHRSLARLAGTHGPLMSLSIGQITTMVISSATLAKQVLQKHDVSFCNRTIPDAIRAHRHHEFGMPWVPIDKRWRNLRKICNCYIFTNQKLDANQDLRRKKIQELVAHVQEHCLTGKAMDIGQAAFTTTLNALSNIIFSLNLSDSSSDTASQLKEVVGGIMEEAGKPNLADYFPVLGWLDLLGTKHRLTIHFGKILSILDGIVNERLQLRKLQGYVPVNDMLDTLLTISEDNNEDIMDISWIKHLLLISKRIRDTIQSLERICCPGAENWSLSFLSHPDASVLCPVWEEVLYQSYHTKSSLNGNRSQFTIVLREMAEGSRLSPPNPISCFVFRAFFKVTYFLLTDGNAVSLIDH